MVLRPSLQSSEPFQRAGRLRVTTLSDSRCYEAIETVNDIGMLDARLLLEDPNRTPQAPPLRSGLCQSELC